jgi:microcystin-dependent protein
MTITVDTARMDYVGAGATAVFPYSFKILDDDDIKVVVRHPTTDVETTLVKTTDYTVSGVDSPTGGNVTLVDVGQAWLDAGGNLDTNWVLSIIRDLDFTQETDIRNQSVFFSSTHEDQFDRTIMQIQQIRNSIQGAMRLPDTVDPTSVSTVLPVPDAYQAMRWDATGTFLENFNLVATGGISLPGTNGIMVQTASGVFAARSIAIASGLAIDNGDGVAANPVVRIANLGVLTAHLGPLSVTEPKVGNGAIIARCIGGKAVEAGAIDDDAVSASNIIDLNVTLAKLSAAVQAALVPTGTLFEWATDTPPSGYLLCYGQAVSRTTYADLFAVISTTFGVGDGSTTFNLPDMRGRMALGQDDMGGASANRVTDAQADSIGGSGGVESHALITAELAAHTHTIPTNAASALDAGLNETHEVGGGGTAPTSSTGSGTAHPNMTPFLTLNYIIKT